MCEESDLGDEERRVHWRWGLWRLGWVDLGHLEVRFRHFRCVASLADALYI